MLSRDEIDEVLELMEAYEAIRDVADGSRPNKAMQACNILREARERSLGQAAWIPVSERLPTLADCTDGDDRVIGITSEGHKNIYIWSMIEPYSRDARPGARITHWQPLAAAPGGKGE